MKHSHENFCISFIGFHVGNTVPYTMIGYTPKTTVISSIDDSDPLQTFYDLICCDVSAINNMAKYISTIPTAKKGTFSLFDTSKWQSMAMSSSFIVPSMELLLEMLI